MIYYVYMQTEPGLWTVGFYDPKGNWISESDHTDKVEAVKRVAYLNGLHDLVGFLGQEES